jgi:hypothetical protein
MMAASMRNPASLSGARAGDPRARMSSIKAMSICDDLCTREHAARRASPILDSQLQSERRTANASACRKDPVSINAPTTTQQEFVKAIDTRDVATQVQIALEATRERMLGAGFNLLDIPDYTPQLAGPFAAGDRHEGAARPTYCNQLYAAFALGIAIGQLCHVDAFTEGSARVNP